MNNLDWKQQIRQNLERAKQGKPRIEFNANFYNALLSSRNQNRQATVAARLKTKAGGKENLMI
jgi:UDP-N-acetyl-D-mannosaminuronic acid transferase (WecB/TagA/CpsF family)